MVEGEQTGTDKHEKSPDRHTHQYTDVGGTHGLTVTAGRQIALHDGLVGAVFLKGIEDSVQYHDHKSELGEVHIVGTESYLVVF